MPEKPPVKTRMEYIPYETCYVEYQPQVIQQSMWVPVQRKAVNYYTVEYVTEYIPK